MPLTSPPDESTALTSVPPWESRPRRRRAPRRRVLRARRRAVLVRRRRRAGLGPVPHPRRGLDPARRRGRPRDRSRPRARRRRPRPGRQHDQAARLPRRRPRRYRPSPDSPRTSSTSRGSSAARASSYSTRTASPAIPTTSVPPRPPGPRRRLLGIDVLAWTLPDEVAARCCAPSSVPTSAGTRRMRSTSSLDVDRTRQRAAVDCHPSQAVPEQCSVATAVRSSATASTCAGWHHPTSSPQRERPAVALTFAPRRRGTQQDAEPGFALAIPLRSGAVE